MQYKVTYKYSVVREVEYASRAVAAQWMMNDVVWEANMKTNITIPWNLPVITEDLSPFIWVKQKLPVYRSELTHLQLVGAHLVSIYKYDICIYN